MVFSCAVPFRRRKKFRIYRCHPVHVLLAQEDEGTAKDFVTEK
jgi:hypothetical protein